MRFAFEHRIAAPLARVEAWALSPEALGQLPRHVPALARVELLALRADAGSVERVARYCPAAAPVFAPGATREMMQWVERLAWDLRTHRGTFAIEPNVPPAWRGRVRGGGEYWLEPRGDAETARLVRGEIVIDVPVLGPLAERFALGQLRRQYAGEAAVLSGVRV